MAALTSWCCCSVKAVITFPLLQSFMQLQDCWLFVNSIQTMCCAQIYLSCSSKKNITSTLTMCYCSMAVLRVFYLLAWTCILQDEQQSRRLVPSSPMRWLVGGGSVFPDPTLKHISGTSGRVMLPGRGRGVTGVSLETSLCGWKSSE